MTRQLTKSDLLIERNDDGNFFYIKPDIPLFPATRLVSNVVISNPADLKGFYPDQTRTHYENISVEGAKAGVGVLGNAGDLRLYDYTFFDTRSDTRFASAIQRGEEHVGKIHVLRAYADGEDQPITSVEGYNTTNTDFFDNNNRAIDPNNISFFRDITAHNFSDAIFDIKSVTYITNATITDAFRILRAHSNTTIIITNSNISTGDGKELIQLQGSNARVYYYNCTWDGRDTPAIDKIGVADVTGGTSARDRVKRANVIKLDADPLATLDPFFTPHVDRYRAQVSVNGDLWKTLSLPSNGWFGQHVGDTLVKVPDLGNGAYRIRAWAVDANGVASSSVTTESFLVTTSSFDYGSGDDALDPPAPWNGTPAADRMNGRDGDDTLSGGAGGDQISGNSGDDILDGGTGGDVMDGGPGNDLLIGGDGDDILYGGPGDDVVRPGDGNDTAHGGEGLDTIDFSTLAAVSGGLIIDLAAGTLRRASDNGVIDRFTSFENAVGSNHGDRIIGTDTVNRLQGGRGADVITSGAGPDVIVFDNAVDFGADRITDFSYSDFLWFTRFTDLGSDRAAPISGSGSFAFKLGVGGERTLQIGQADRWLEYVGENSDGYHVYRLLQGGWPDRDILPVDKDPNTGVDLPAPVRIGETLSFAGAPANAGGYVINLATGIFREAAAGGEERLFEPLRNVIGTASNDRIYGDNAANRIDGGRGDDVMSSGGGADIFMFDNSVDFGADRITDFSFSRALWFTQATDLGPDNVARIAKSGLVWFDYGDGAGQQSVNIGFGDRWIAYDGRNAEGYHVYSLMEGAWPTVDLLPASSPSGVATQENAASTESPEAPAGPTLIGSTPGDVVADFSAAAPDAQGYVIDLGLGQFYRENEPRNFAAFDARHIVATSSADYLIGDHHANRLEGGRGDDVITGGGGADAFVFDNRVDFGADRLTDFNFSRTLWFTEFTDLGADDVARIGDDGRVAFSFNGGAGMRLLDLGVGSRWIEYDGQNDAGYHVYSLMEGAWPGQDILPA